MSLDPGTRAWLTTALKNGLLDEATREFVATELGVSATARVGIEDRWDANLQDLVAFHEEFKTLPRPDRLDPREKRLRRWMDTQIEQRRRSEMSEERITKLSNSHPTVRLRIAEGLSANEFRWRQNLDSVSAFVQAHDILPRENGGLDDEPRLARWTATQVNRFNKSLLSAEHIELIEQSHPSVSQRILQKGKPNLVQGWTETLTELTEFAIARGSMPVKTGDTDETRLRVWVATQITQLGAGQLSLERIEAIRTSHPMVRERILQEAAVPAAAKLPEILAQEDVRPAPKLNWMRGLWSALVRSGSKSAGGSPVSI